MREVSFEPMSFGPNPPGRTQFLSPMDLTGRMYTMESNEPQLTELTSSFHAQSFSEVNPEQKSTHSAWETPDPLYWTKHGYVVVRTDERGTGQSPGFLDTMSRGTSEAFFGVVEWAADQKWSSGKVGLLGISYYAGSQWRVAARRP